MYACDENVNDIFMHDVLFEFMNLELFMNFDLVYKDSLVLYFNINSLVSLMI